MENTFFHELFQTLTNAEVRQLQKFVASPYFNGRPQLVPLLDYLAERQDDRIDELPSRHIALRRCLEKLPKPQRDLVKARYAPGGSVKHIASKLGRSVGSISQTLYRARSALLECIENSMRSDPEQTL